jgi:hypothetical protein
MNNWAITSGDGNTIKIGTSIEGLDFSQIPNTVHALQWFPDTNTGWIENKDSTTNILINNETITSLPAWAVSIFAAYDTALAAQQAALLAQQTSA